MYNRHMKNNRNKEYEKAYYLKNREKRIATAKAWHAAHPGENSKAQCERNARLRKEMIDVYGSVCGCCGENNPGFLTIDHIRMDGQPHRKALGGSGVSFLGALKRLGWPKDGLQLRCMNCNWATRYGRTCPHKLPH